MSGRDRRASRRFRGGGSVEPDDDAAEEDRRASRRVGGTGGDSPAPDPDPEPDGSDFRDDQRASRQVGGSGDPTADQSSGSDFRDDQRASRQVGGSGDPADPTAASEADSRPGSVAGAGGSNSPFVEDRAAAALNDETASEVTPRDVQIDDGLAQLDAEARREEREAQINEALSDRRERTDTDRETVEPGAAAEAVGSATEFVSSRTGSRLVGRGADAAFGTDSADRGAVGPVIDALDAGAEATDAAVADRIRSADPQRTAPVAPGVGGLTAAANTEFVRGGAAQATEMLNPAAIGRDALVLTSAGAQAGDFLADEGAEGAQVAGETAADVAQAAPGAAVDLGEFIVENPGDAAQTTAALAVTGGVGAAAGRGARAAGGRVSRALRETPEAPDTPEGTVPSGRSDVGTAGRGSLLEDVDVDAERGITGPSARSRVARLVDDSALGDLLDDTRGQVQAGRQRSRDTGDGVDPTRPADAGGTFEDVRQDALTETQDQLRSDATRPTPGTFEGAPDPFRSGGGDTIDADGVQLQRTTGTPEVGGGVDDAAATREASAVGGVVGVSGRFGAPGGEAATGATVADDDPQPQPNPGGLVVDERGEIRDPEAVTPGVQPDDPPLLSGDPELGDVTSVDSRQDSEATAGQPAPSGVDTQSAAGAVGDVGLGNEPRAETGQPQAGGQRSPTEARTRPPETAAQPRGVGRGRLASLPRVGTGLTRPQSATGSRSGTRPRSVSRALLASLGGTGPRRPRAPDLEPEAAESRDSDAGGAAVVSVDDEEDDAVGFFAETLTALSVGGFGEREPAESNAGFGLEIPTATLADPAPDEEASVESVTDFFGVGESDNQTEGGSFFQF